MQKKTSEWSFLEALRLTRLHGNIRLTRNGLTKAIFAHQMRFNLQEGFPLLTTKEIKWKSMVAELLWFLDAGRDTGYRLSLQKLNEIQGKAPDAWNIWKHDQARFASQGKARFHGDCGRIYGAQWRNWNKYFNAVPLSSFDDSPHAAVLGSGAFAKDADKEILQKTSIDQIGDLIMNLKKDPFSRYHIVTAWNPAEINDMCLPPCHMKMQFFVREINNKKYLDTAMDQRSCDMFLGVPFNIASYALLLHMIAQCVDMLPGELVMTLNDCHIYLAERGENDSLDHTKGHMKKVELQLSRTPYQLPNLWLNPEIRDIDSFTMNDIDIRNYQHHEFIKGDLL